LLLVLLCGCGRVDGQPSVTAHNGPLPLAPGVRVGQTFVPAGDEVAAVALLVSTGGAPVEGTLTVSLRDDPAGPLRTRAQVDGAALRDNRWAVARFARPVRVPAGAAFEVAWTGGGTVAVYANVPQRTSPLVNDPYPGGRLLRQGVPAEGDLVFDVLGPDWTTVTPTLATAARRTIGRLLATPAFLAAWLVLLAGAAALAARGGRPRRAGRPPRADHLDGGLPGGREPGGSGGDGRAGAGEVGAAGQQLGDRGQGQEHGQGGEGGVQERVEALGQGRRDQRGRGSG